LATVLFVTIELFGFLVKSEEKWYHTVRCNSLLPITSQGQAAAMCAQGFEVFRSSRQFVRYDSDPWGISYHLNRPPKHLGHLKHWHVDVLNIEIDKGIDDKIKEIIQEREERKKRENERLEQYRRRMKKRKHWRAEALVSSLCRYRL